MAADPAPPPVLAVAPGRVNLIGDHTDTTGGLVLPMAIHLATTIRGRRRGPSIRLTSDTEPEPALLALTPDPGPGVVVPDWARYVAGVTHELGPAHGLEGEVATTLPVGAGLSSSAALEVAVALALDAEPGPWPHVALARLCQRAEQWASGVPCGIMDQLASVAGVAGHALLIDCTGLLVEPVPLPEGVDVVVVHSGEPRRLAGSAYAQRRAEVTAAEAALGPLRLLAPGDEAALAEPVLRRRARHVLAENERVRACATALRSGDAAAAGALMAASHASLRDDFEVSTPALDALVEHLGATAGVHGARLTGAGFGGCVVALTERGALHDGWKVRAVDGAVAATTAARAASGATARSR
ncbi:MAG: galactokinase [Actinobacteria bacterium]|nr:galactokinase [Actinomycetota bacterium]